MRNIEKELKEVIRSLGIDRMPSRSEIEMVKKESGLVTAIGRSGGFKVWATKLGLKTKKECDNTLKWHDSVIESKIKDCMFKLGIDRMPSRSETEVYSEDNSLSNAIAKNGGFYYWADRLKIPVKESETKTGIDAEYEIKKKLTGFGYLVEMTPTKFPYDLLVNNNVKIDVKISNGSYVKKSLCYTCNLEFTIPKCDIIVFVCAKEKVYVIPTKYLVGIKQLSIGKNKSKYDRFIDKWDYIDKYLKFYDSI